MLLKSVISDVRLNKSLYFKKLFVLFVFLLVTSGYFFVNLYNDFRMAQGLIPTIWAFGIDYYIPFTRFAVIPYISWYVYVTFTVLYLIFSKESKNYFKFIYSMIAGACISYFIFVLFPTHVPRPELMGNDIFTILTASIYNADPPYNCFPSMHVLYAFLCFIFLHKKFIGRNYLKILNAGIFIIICASTVFTKQHYTPDILGGIVIGLLIHYFPYFAGRIGRHFPVSSGGK